MVHVDTAAPRGDAVEAKGVLVDTADIPGGGQLQLVRYGQDYEILFDSEQLMGSWAHQSEEALASLVAERLGTRAEQILIGGLGMGFTLSAALSSFPSTARIVVAELVPQVVAWASGPLASILGNSLDDPRVSIHIRDVHDVIVEQRARFDAILLDVDNGPDGMISLANERLYCAWGLRASYDALRPGGMLAVWSAFTDGTFTKRLQDVGFRVLEFQLATGGSDDDPHHTIWLGARP